jgi:hypothetical protein
MRSGVAARGRVVAGALFLLSLAASILIAAPPVSACSCAPPDVRTWLRDADGAFVGTWLKRAVPGDGPAFVTFRVERVVKGSFGPNAVVRTSEQGGACGLEMLGRSRTGLLLDQGDHGVWESNLCWMVAPGALLAVDGDHPPDPSIRSMGAGWSSTTTAL